MTKKLLTLIDVKGKSKEQIKEEIKRALKNKGMLDKKGKLTIKNK